MVGLVVLDALGDRLQPQPTREVDRRGHDRRARLVHPHARDEPAVDLQPVDRQPAQV